MGDGSGFPGGGRNPTPPSCLTGLAALLDALLHAVVPRLADRLQVTLIPKQAGITPMGHDVIDHRAVGSRVLARQQDAGLLASVAITLQHPETQPLPARRVQPIL